MVGITCVCLMPDLPLPLAVDDERRVTRRRRPCSPPRSASQLCLQWGAPQGRRAPYTLHPRRASARNQFSAEKVIRQRERLQ